LDNIGTEVSVGNVVMVEVAVCCAAGRKGCVLDGDGVTVGDTIAGVDGTADVHPWRIKLALSKNIRNGLQHLRIDLTQAFVISVNNIKKEFISDCPYLTEIFNAKVIKVNILSLL